MTQLPIAPIRPKRSAIGMKTLGSDDAARRVVPAQQRLGAGDLAARRVDLRLVVQLELALRRARLRRSRSSSNCSRAPCVHARLEEAVGRAAGALGGVHRRVGVGDQLAIGAVVGVDRDADRARDHRPRGRSTAVRLAERLEQARRRQARRVLLAPGCRAAASGTRRRRGAPTHVRPRDMRLQPLRRPARSTRSPPAWPSESLTGLKPSRSMNSSAKRPVRLRRHAAPPAPACPRTSAGSAAGSADRGTTGAAARLRHGAATRRRRASRIDSTVATSRIAIEPTEASRLSVAGAMRSAYCEYVWVARPAASIANCWREHERDAEAPRRRPPAQPLAERRERARMRNASAQAKTAPAMAAT